MLSQGGQDEGVAGILRKLGEEVPRRPMRHVVGHCQDHQGGRDRVCREQGRGCREELYMPAGPIEEGQ